MESLFASPTLAAGYARARPAVQERVMEGVRRHLKVSERMNCAVDVGCGAGLSTPARGVGEDGVGNRTARSDAELDAGSGAGRLLCRWSGGGTSRPGQCGRLDNGGGIVELCG